MFGIAKHETEAWWSGRFWQWVVSLESGDDARGELIFNTRDCLDGSLDPQQDVDAGSPEVRAEYAKLIREWSEANPRDPRAERIVRDLDQGDGGHEA